MYTLLALPLLLASTVSALPNWRTSWAPTRSTQSSPTLPLNELAPSNTGALALPTPTQNPVVIALGIGTQNYTCSSSGAYVQSGTGNGAKATLYDVTQLLTQHPDEVSKLPGQAYQAYESCSDKNQCSAPPQTYVLGKHFFSAAGVPTFDLYNAKPKPLYLNAGKKGDVKSPSGSANAVDWLFLQYSGVGTAVGLTSVYRVETVAGVAPAGTCTPGQTALVDYAAEYWFYD